ncbi:NAD(+) synthase [candidate division KSB1 bacterium]|nr:NAD(+) synthase [candidate division KSB1 bacterium]
MFDQTVLNLDCESEVNRIGEFLKTTLTHPFNRRGAVVAMSGGVDSSVCAALCVRILGPERVFGLLLPESDSSQQSEDFGELVARQLNIQYLKTNITSTLEAIGCYKWRDEAIQKVFPEYQAGWKHKIVISQDLLESNRLNFFKLIVQKPSGELVEKRLSLEAYLQIVAATNFKQRIRKTLEYFHADRLNYVVIGTPNLLEYDQGFFVKNGDGSADIKPIAHLYKTQVYQLARFLNLPEKVCNQRPTTDTYSLPQGQDEFYFVLPYEKMDLALYALNHQIPAEEAAPVIGITPVQLERVFTDIERKRKTTRYLHTPPVTMNNIK